MKKAEKFKLIKVTEFDESKLIIPMVDINTRSNKEGVYYKCFPKYEYREANDYGNIGVLTFKTGNICLKQYGMYIFENSGEGYVKVPLDYYQKACVELFSFIDKLDKIGKSKEIQEKLYDGKLTTILNKKMNYYVQLHKEGKEFDSDYGNGCVYKMDYIKLLIDINRETNNLKTKVYLYNKYNKKNKRMYTMRSIKDLKKYVDIGSEVEFIISVEKIQVSKTSINGCYENRFILRCKQIKINKKCIKKGPENMDMCGFSEDEYDSDEENNADECDSDEENNAGECDSNEENNADEDNSDEENNAYEENKYSKKSANNSDSELDLLYNPNEKNNIKERNIYNSKESDNKSNNELGDILDKL